MPPVRAARDDEFRCVNVVEMLDVIETGQLIVELFALEEMHNGPLRRGRAAAAACAVLLVTNIRPLRHPMSAPNWREDYATVRHKNARYCVELRAATRVYLAAMIPYNRGKWSRPVRLEHKAYEAKAVTLERDSLLRRRG